MCYLYIHTLNYAESQNKQKQTKIKTPTTRCGEISDIFMDWQDLSVDFTRALKCSIFKAIVTSVWKCFSNGARAEFEPNFLSNKSPLEWNQYKICNEIYYQPDSQRVPWRSRPCPRPSRREPWWSESLEAQPVKIEIMLRTSVLNQWFSTFSGSSPG